MQIGPTKEQQRFIDLANLKVLDPSKGQDHSAEMWHIIRGMAVLDYALLSPDHALAVFMQESSLNAEEKFRTLMRKVQQLAEIIQEEQSGHNGYKH